MEVQQSDLYESYIKKLKWHSTTCGKTKMYFRHIPFTGGLAKIQRCTTLPALDQLIPILKENNIKSVAIEPDASVDQSLFTPYIEALKKHVRINKTPFIPTKTILVDLTPKEDAIFHRFTEAKQRAVRRAQKQGITIVESKTVDEIIKIKNASAGMFGFITTYGARALWETFAPTHVTSLIAQSDTGEAVGGVLLLFWNKRASYWIAGATKKGKKLFAPTLLVWEAIRRSKKEGCTEFDFVGVWDERLPHHNSDWKGFTKFKEGFGGSTHYYPLATT